MDEIQQAVDQLYKSHFGKLVSSTLHFSNDIDLETAEDIVQDAFSAALVSWRKDGMPINGAGWLFRVCQNKGLNKIKENKKFSRLLTDENIHPDDPALSKPPFDDPQLTLLFACAHPDLSPKVQVVITLKYVVNLKVESIAGILGMTVDGIDKLLVRARQKIKDEKIFFREQGIAELGSKIHIVHKILYLIFNEGYKSSWGKELIREELCEEALIMTRILTKSVVANKETFALYALMLFNASRFKARFGSEGELLDLEEQDRNLWNHDLIQFAFANLDLSEGDIISSYHYEASIAGIHSCAKNFAATDWRTITLLYNKMLKINPNPFVELNYAIALYYSGQKEQSFRILNQLLQHPFLSQYYLLNSALGKLNWLEGNHEVAEQFLLKAIRQTNSVKEKEYIKKMIAKVVSSKI